LRRLWEISVEPDLIPKLIAEGAKLATDAYQLYVALSQQDWPLAMNAGIEIAIDVILILKKMGWDPEEAIEELKRRLGL